MTSISALSATAYIMAAGFCFMLANLFMKTLADMPIFILYPAVASAFVVGAYCEVEALKSLQLGYAVAFILVAEMIFSFLIALVFLRENYTAANFAGIGLIMGGIVLLNTPSGESAPAEKPVSGGAHQIGNDGH